MHLVFHLHVGQMDALFWLFFLFLSVALGLGFCSMSHVWWLHKENIVAQTSWCFLILSLMKQSYTPKHWFCAINPYVNVLSTLLKPCCMMKLSFVAIFWSVCLAKKCPFVSCGRWYFDSHLIDDDCRTPTLAKCGGEAQHLEKSGVGVLRDSRMFRARQKGAKHLALGCSWCHWKGLEV